MDAATYQRARADGTPAAQAVRLARWIAEDRIETPEYGSPVTLERDGFTITLSVDYDEGLTLADLGYGTFVDGRENDAGYQSRPDPEAVPNPYRDSRNVSNGAAWYLPGMGGTLAERAAYNHEHGASKSVALDLARESVNDELRHVTWDYGPSVYVLTVKASRNGITLGRASLGGIEIAWSDVTRTDGSEYFAEVADDLIPEAIDEAQEALKGLVAHAQV